MHGAVEDLIEMCWMVLTSKINENLDHLDIIRNLVDFKSFTGEFMERRLNKVLKTYSKLGINHYDDLSVGAIYTGE